MGESGEVALGSRVVFLFPAPGLHQLLDPACELGAGPEPLYEHGAAFEEEVLSGGGEFSEIS